MSEKLSFKLLQRNLKSDFDWMNIDLGDIRVGKVRGLIIGEQVTIHSINIFPEFERQGYAKQTIEMLKENFKVIIADRVRLTALEFWLKMGFKKMKDDNYIWGS